MTTRRRRVRTAKLVVATIRQQSDRLRARRAQGTRTRRHRMAIAHAFRAHRLRCSVATLAHSTLKETRGTTLASGNETTKTSLCGSRRTPASLVHQSFTTALTMCAAATRWTERPTGTRAKLNATQSSGTMARYAVAVINLAASIATALSAHSAGASLRIGRLSGCSLSVLSVCLSTYQHFIERSRK